MKSLVPYLIFGKNCREAMEFYRDCLGGKLEIMTVGESPVAGQMPGEMRSLVMHASLEGGAFELMASDDLGGEGVSLGTAINLMICAESEAELRSIFAKLAVGGRVNAEPKVEFWGDLYGDLTDRFGIRWMFTFEMPAR